MFCEEEIEKLTLSSTYIAVIAGCSGAVVIIALVAVIVYLVIKMKRRTADEKEG